ncbi:MAG: type II/IV secretion system ATPase subunit [Candidatus Hadarchaeia archaeon]
MKKEELKKKISQITDEDKKDDLSRKIKEKNRKSKRKISSILKKDKKIKEVRSAYDKYKTETGEISQKAGLEQYDPLKHGSLLETEEVKGFKEKEEYWIESPYSKVKILQNTETGESKYHLLEPKLTEEQKDKKNVIWRELQDRLPYKDITENKDKILGKHFRKIINELKLKDPSTKHKLIYYIVRDNLGYGKIDPLMRDEAIEDISCDGINIPIYIYHQNHYNLKTNISFKEDEINSFVNILAEKSGDHLSYADPVVESTLPDGSRLQVTLGKEVTTKGSSFTIRKFGGSSFTPVDLIRYGTFDPEMLSILWVAIENSKSIMVVGGTASGKTSTLNALGFFIPPDAKIVSIEDTRELSLYQENWLPNLTRETSGGENLDMHELVRKAMRQRPECIIVGEVRGKEALAMFQAISTGHAGFSTMHAGSVQDAANRLLGEPINLPKPMLAELDMICLQILTNLGEKRVRRNKSTVEFLGLDTEKEKLKTTKTFSWVRENDSFRKIEDSQVLREIREEQGLSITEMNTEVERRARLLKNMADKPIISYGEISDLIRQYYFKPEKTLEKVSRGV